MKAIRFHVNGGPDVLVLDEVPRPKPNAGEVLVRVRAAGVNFKDVYQRSGSEQTPLPYVPGLEGAGVTETAVDDLPAGTRVAWAAHTGAYADYMTIPRWKLVRVPDNIDDANAAAALLQGITAQYLTETTYVVRPGDVALVHAGAGGVGLLLIQVLKHKGATVLTTVSTAEKAELARAAGADHVIRYTDTDFVAAVRDATGGLGAHVVYDSVGKSTFDGSLSATRPLGMVVLFGHSSGLVPPLDPLELMKRGSLFLTRPTLAHYIADADSLRVRAETVLRWLETKVMNLHIGHRYPLADAAKAHADLEARRTTGKLVLDVA